MSRSIGGNLAVFLLLAAMAAFTALPIVYALLNAFKPLNELFIYPPQFFIINPTLDNFRELLQLPNEMLIPFERYLFNSLLISVFGTVGYIVIASLAAYPLARAQFPLKTLLTQLIVWGILFTPEVLSIPQFMVVSKLGFIDTYWSYVFPVFSGSFGVYLMRQFMSTIPSDIYEAAKIDGCGEWRLYARITMPMVKPAWLTLTLFTFLAVWNSGASTQFVYDERLKTLPAALSQIGTTGGYARLGVASAVIIVLMIPPILIFVVTQSSVLETMSHSGINE